jgi:hypothetical protein
MKMTKTAKKSDKSMAAKTAKRPKPAMSEAKLPMRGSRTAKNMKSKGMK